MSSPASEEWITVTRSRRIRAVVLIAALLMGVLLVAGRGLPIPCGR